jgi:serine/threonine protein kinase
VTVIAERYRLEREIGRGGMGTVWLAQDTVLGRPVAIKRIGTMPGASEADLDRVLREARVSAMLSDEHVVVVFDLATEADQHWLVMEYVESETLAQLVQRRGPLPLDEVAAVAAQAATALAAAHEAGIVHRDVKPSNLLVSPTGHVKLSDFGIARAEADQALTQTGLVVGSPGYLAPEIATGGVATSVSDMWSLGATIFHAVEGHPPYDTSGNLIAAMYRIVNEQPPEPEHAGWLTPLVRALMDRDPAGRWTAGEVRDFLQAGPQGVTRALPREAAAVAGQPRGLGETMRVIDPDDLVALDDERPRRPWDRLPGGAPVLAASVVLILLLVGLVLSRLVSDNPKGSVATPKGNSVAESKSPEAAGSSGSPAADSGPSEAGMTKFVEDYLATAPTDPRTSFAQLTPHYQQQSGGFDGYERFWGTVASAEPTGIKAVPEDLTVSFLAKYRLDNGKQRTDGVTLHLIYNGKEYLIDGDESRQVRS